MATTRDDPRPVGLAQALSRKLALLVKYGTFWPAVGRALRLVLCGRFRLLFQKLRKAEAGPAFDPPAEYDPPRAYEEWQRRQALTDADRAAHREAAGRPGSPLVSVLMIATDPEPIRSMLDSLRRQTYPKWEACLAVNIATLPVQDERDDPRIRFIKTEACCRAGAANAALDAARGDIVTLLGAGDELAEHALFRVAESALADPRAEVHFGDEDRLEDAGQRATPFFKPGWSPEALLGQANARHPCFLRAELLRRLGGWRRDRAGAEEFDLALRVAAATDRVRHIPDILHHLRAPLAPLPEASVHRAIADHLAETGRPGDIDPARAQVRFHLAGRPLVSIIIPTAFAGQKVAACVRSIQALSTWEDREILLVADRDAPAGLRETLESHGARFLLRKGPFNFSATISHGASHARGSHLLLLNDDTEVISPDWLERMLEYSQQSAIGAVGARLLFPHGRLQHVGIHMLDGYPWHAWYGYPGDHPGHFGSHAAPWNCCAVTGACLMTRRDVFDELGGLDGAFPLSFNDVDYCLRVGRTGRRIVCTPHATLIHHEAYTRRGADRAKASLFAARWGKGADLDPYYNPNLAKDFPDYRIDPDAARASISSTPSGQVSRGS